MKKNNEDSKDTKGTLETTPPDKGNPPSPKSEETVASTANKTDSQNKLASKPEVSTGAKPVVSKEAEASTGAKPVASKEAEARLEKPSAPEPKLPSVKLNGLYAFKLGMSSIYDDKGQFTPVTFLQFRPWFVSQIKTKDKEGYSSIQVACKAQKNNRCSKALVAHLSSAGFKQGAGYIREIRQDLPEGIKVGQALSIDSIGKGDIVTLSGTSKGHGFSGVVKRWGFKGGRASHGGSATLRSAGSIGNRTEPARVMPGKKMAGHYGGEQVSLKNVKVWQVLADKKLIIVKGAVPGARNSLVFLQKLSS